MEQSGLPGCIQLSASTHALLPVGLGLQAREGGVDVKGLGRLPTWVWVPPEELLPSGSSLDAAARSSPEAMLSLGKNSGSWYFSQPQSEESLLLTQQGVLLTRTLQYLSSGRLRRAVVAHRSFEAPLDEILRTSDFNREASPALP